MFLNSFWRHRTKEVVLLTCTLYVEFQITRPMDHVWFIYLCPLVFNSPTAFTPACSEETVWLSWPNWPIHDYFFIVNLQSTNHIGQYHNNYFIMCLVAYYLTSSVYTSSDVITYMYFLFHLVLLVNGDNQWFYENREANRQ